MDDSLDSLGFSFENDLQANIFNSPSAFGWFFSPTAPTGDPAIFGFPVESAEFWRLQDTPFTCAVVCQQMILAKFGIQVSEAQLVYDATVNGWLTDSGTSPLDLGRLLEYYGVDTRTDYGGDVETLAAELARGRKVIIGVDSSLMAGGNVFWEKLIGDYGADHAIVVTGLDMSDPSKPQVYVNDPGDPYGAGRAYPLDEFLRAWDASGQLYVTTLSAPPSLESDALFGSNYDPDTGWYMDLDYWKKFLESVVVGAAAAYGVVEAWSYLSNLWSEEQSLPMGRWAALDDADRNRLFQSI